MLLRLAGSAVLLLLLGALAGAPPARAEEEARETVVVGTKEAPPFAMKDADGHWTGISVELWNGMAEQLGVDTAWREVELDELVDGLEAGRLDASVAALTMTAAREARIDFSHPFHTSGLGIATRPGGGGGLSAIFGRLFSSAFLKALLALAGILLLAGFLVWLFERRRNAAQFGGGTAKGLGSGFWWSAVTMTTVGYGDKAPVTAGGRLVALVWMFASILLIAGFTGAIASALTVSELEGAVNGPEDLPGLRVATVEGSTSAAWLARRGIDRRFYATPKEALEAVAAGRADAAVYDHPLLLHLVSTEPSLADALVVLPRTFQRQDYAIGLPPSSPYRETVNQALLETIASEAWSETLTRHLGR